MLIIKLFFGYLFIVLPYFSLAKKMLENKLNNQTKQQQNKAYKQETNTQTNKTSYIRKKTEFQKVSVSHWWTKSLRWCTPHRSSNNEIFRQIGLVIFNRKSWSLGPLNWGYVLTNFDVSSIWNAEKSWLRRHGLQFHSRYTRQLANRLDSLLMHPSVNFWVNPHNWMLRQVLIHVPQLLPN